ncbi:MAG: hypothetical protein JO266_13290 [Acidobacteria bacterium]|nr:hypothetical protein [Acidobacteriota bacterium]
MVDFTLGINARDGEIGVTIILEDREETFTIEEAESFHDILGLQINLAKTLTQPDGKIPRILNYDRDAASRFR